VRPLGRCRRDAELPGPPRPSSRGVVDRHLAVRRQRWSARFRGGPGAPRAGAHLPGERLGSRLGFGGAVRALLPACAAGRTGHYRGDTVGSVEARADARLRVTGGAKVTKVLVGTTFLA